MIPIALLAVGTLHAAYQAWGDAIRTPRRFGLQLREAGYVSRRTGSGYEVIGLGLAATSD